MKRNLVLLIIISAMFLAGGCSDDDGEATCKCGAGFACDPDTQQCVPALSDSGVTTNDGSAQLHDSQAHDGPAAVDTAPAGDSAPQTTYFDTVCPPQVTPITTNKTLTGRTTDKPVEGHCGINDPFTAVGQVTVTEETKVRLMATAAADVEIVLSLRTECTVDHGCFLGLASADYQRIVAPGTYNIFVATNKVADFTLQVELLPPTPDTGND